MKFDKERLVVGHVDKHPPTQHLTESHPQTETEWRRPNLYPSVITVRHINNSGTLYPWPPFSSLFGISI